MWLFRGEENNSDIVVSLNKKCISSYWTLDKEGVLCYAKGVHRKSRTAYDRVWSVSSLFQETIFDPSGAVQDDFCLVGVDLIKLPLLLYVFGQTDLSRQCRLRSDAAERGVWSGSAHHTPQNAASDQNLHCLLLTQQFYTHSIRKTCLYNFDPLNST